MAATRKKGFNLDELQKEVEVLLNLLKDRQPGLYVWNEQLRQRMWNVQALTTRALGK